MRSHPRHGPGGDCYLPICHPRWSVSTACPSTPFSFPLCMMGETSSHCSSFQNFLSKDLRGLRLVDVHNDSSWKNTACLKWAGWHWCRSVCARRGEYDVGGSCRGQTERSHLHYCLLPYTCTCTAGFSVHDANSAGQNRRLTSMRIDNPFMLMSA